MEEIKEFLDKVPNFLFNITLKEFCENVYDKDFNEMKNHELRYIEPKYEL